MRFYVIKLPRFLSCIIRFFANLFSKDKQKK
ncbi:MAG: stage V sporulation protein SpoVM [Bacilli bacterium]|nr:stage V sporulation protein SpoVM [Acholeplasmataceae bacterium]